MLCGRCGLCSRRNRKINIVLGGRGQNVTKTLKNRILLPSVSTLVTHCSYNIASWGFIEACATCSPINTLSYYDIQDQNVLFTAISKFGLCIIFVNNLCKWLAKMLDGKFCSDWPHIINSKNSQHLTKDGGEEFSQQRH